MKKIYLLILLSLLLNSLYSNKIETIIQSGDYYWGRGEATDYETADVRANSNLSNQISVIVQSRFTTQHSEIINNSNSGNETKLIDHTNSFIETYSCSFIKESERIVEPPSRDNDNYVIYKYIEKEELLRIFEARKERAIDFLRRGDMNLLRLNIHRALFDYYSGLLLISSHPDYDELRVKTDSGRPNLKLALEDALTKTFSGITITRCGKAEDLTTYLRYNIKATYNGQKINHLQFTYFDGNQQIEGNFNNGIGIVDLLKSYTESTSEIPLSVVYGKGITAEQQLMDPELKALEGFVFVTSFDNKYTLDITSKTTKKEADIDQEYVSTKKMGWAEKRGLNKMIKNIVESIRTNQYDNIQKYFTKSGFNQYMRIMNHGEVSLCEEDFTLKYLNMGNQIQIRSIPIAYRLTGVRPKVIVERINLIVENDSITWVNYSLDDKLIDEAIEIDSITNDLSTRLMSINFMEYYKTIFNTKQIDLINDIFANDAKIFVGYVKRSEPVDCDFVKEINNQLSKNIRVKEYTKEDYIKNLASVFKTNAFINISFRNYEIIKRSKIRPIYALQMHQDFYSDRYSDQGYLLLFVDFSQQNEPKIFFRFWQPEKIDEEELRLLTPGDISW